MQIISNTAIVLIWSFNSSQKFYSETIIDSFTDFSNIAYSALKIMHPHKSKKKMATILNTLYSL